MASSNVNKSGKVKEAGDQIPGNTHLTVSEVDTRHAVLTLANRVTMMQNEMREGFATLRPSMDADTFAIRRAKQISLTASLHFKRMDLEIKRLRALLQEQSDGNLQKQIEELRANLKDKEEEISCSRELRYCIKAQQDAIEANNLARWQNIADSPLQDQHLIAMRNAQNGPLLACPTDLEDMNMLTDSDINQLLTDLGLSLHGSVEQRHYRLADFMGVADRLYCLTKGAE